MTDITLNQSERLLLQTLYNKLNMRYIAWDSTDCATVFQKKPEWDDMFHMYYYPEIKLDPDQVEFLDKINIVCIKNDYKLNIEENNIMFHWLTKECAALSIKALLELTANDKIISLKQVQEWC